MPVCSWDNSLLRSHGCDRRPLGGRPTGCRSFEQQPHGSSPRLVATREHAAPRTGYCSRDDSIAPQMPGPGGLQYSAGGAYALRRWRTVHAVRREHRRAASRAMDVVVPRSIPLNSEAAFCITQLRCCAVSPHTSLAKSLPSFEQGAGA